MPRPWQLDAGGTYNPSRAQRIIWRQWAECWETIRNLRNVGDRVIVTVMGDCVDGKHHDTSELVTQRVEEQERIFIECLDWALKVIDFDGHDLLQFIAGTPAHAGELAQAERRIASDFNAQLYDRRKFEVHGVKFDLCHDGMTIGKRAWTDDTSLRSVLKSMLFEGLLYRQEIPDFVIRAHRHRWMFADFARGKYEIQGFMCPAFQLKTNYGVRYTSTSAKPPDIGMLYVLVQDNGSTEWGCPRIEWPKEKFEVL